MNKVFSLMLLAAVTISCTEQEPAADSQQTASVLLKPGINDFVDLMEDSLRINPAIAGDFYNLEGIRYNNGKLIVSVGYSGGCKNHTFEVQGKVSPVLTNPPKADIVIVHDAHDDSCEAYLREDIEVDLTALLGADQVDLRIFNPTQLETRYASLAYRHLQQGNGCDLGVTFETVICGTGVYENRWFKLKSEELYLQPVSLGFSVDDSQLQLNNSYKVSFWETRWTGSDTVATCLAYPGPSLPAEIVCIR